MLKYVFPYPSFSVRRDPCLSSEIFTRENRDTLSGGGGPNAMTQVLERPRSQSEPQFPRLGNRPGASS